MTTARNLLLVGSTLAAIGTGAWGADPVAGAMERMSAHAGLSDAVTAVVFNNPSGRIHGHEADRIDVSVDDHEGTAEIRFVMPKEFKLHGDRLVKCLRRDDTWTCAEER